MAFLLNLGTALAKGVSREAARRRVLMTAILERTGVWMVVTVRTGDLAQQQSEDKPGDGLEVKLITEGVKSWWSGVLVAMTSLCQRGKRMVQGTSSPISVRECAREQKERIDRAKRVVKERLDIEKD